MHHEQCVLLFVKFPEQERVKTRLSKVIGEENARALYKCFVHDVLDTLGKGDFSITICYSPPFAGESVKEWLGKSYSYMPQRGQDLGERMKCAFEDAFRSGVREAILIGTDIPDISAFVIRDAFSFHKHAAVIGPSRDGGYYLIGFRKDTLLPGVFEGIEWGTGAVFEKTMKVFRKHGYSVGILPHWRDTDRIEDLRDLYKRNSSGPFAGSRTMAFLQRIYHLIS
ncbi:MAG: TIGR04282 family arsenosugar biosynthesis glycosyltransferase [Nitrospirota bacterium]